MHLASIRNRAEADEVRRITHTKSPVWIGANDLLKEGRWMWTDGTMLAWTNWHRKEPNNYGGREDCGALWNGFKWNDWFCSSKAYFICERRMSTIQMERAQRRKEAWQRKQAALHLIYARRAAWKRLVYLKGRRAYLMKAAFELKWRRRAIAMAHKWLKYRRIALKKARYEAHKRLVAEHNARIAHKKRLMWQAREAHAHRRRKLAYAQARIQAAIARKALARARYERKRRAIEVRRAHYAKILRIRAQRAAAHAIKVRNHYLRLAHAQRMKELHFIRKARAEARATVALVLRSKETVRKSRLRMRLYMAKMRVQHKLRHRADHHTRIALRAVARLRVAFKIAMRKMHIARHHARVYSAHFKVYRTRMHNERRLAHIYFKRAAHSRRVTRAALHRVKIYNRKTSHLLVRMNHYKMLYYASIKRTRKHNIMYARYMKAAANYHRGKVAFYKKWRVDLHYRNHYNRLTHVFGVRVRNLKRAIVKMHIKHNNMVRFYKKKIAGLIIRQHIYMRNLHKWGKGRLNALRIRIARL